MGFSKWAALGVFVVQNAGVILLMRYSKVHSDSTGSYNSAVAVLMQEVTKVRGPMSLRDFFRAVLPAWLTEPAVCPTCV